MVVTPLFVALFANSVSYEADAVHVEILLKDLSRQSGQSLSATPEVGAEPVVIQIADRPLDEVLERLAKVIDAEWTRSGEARILARPTGLKSRLAAEERKQVDAQIDRLLVGLEAEGKALPAFDKEQAEKLVNRYLPNEATSEQYMAAYARLQQSNPVSQTAIRFLHTLGATRLREMYVGQRVVFSDKPNLVQLQLPSKANPFLDKLKSNTRLMMSIVKKPKPTGQYIQIQGLPALGPGRFDVGYGKLLFAVRRTSLLRFSYRLTLTDAEGQNLVWASGELPERLRSMEAAYTHQGKEIALSEEAQNFAWLRMDIGYAAAGSSQSRLEDGTEIVGSFSVSMAEANGRPPDLNLAKVLSDPVENDPLGFVPGALLRQLAQERRKPLLATLSDGTIVSIMEAVSRKQITTLADFEDFLNQSKTDAAVRIPNASFLEDPEWILARPVFRTSSRELRMNRGALKSLMASIRQAGSVLLEDAARYLEKASVAPRLGSLDFMYLTHFDPTIDRRAAEWLLGPALPFMATLTDGQWDRLKGSAGSFADLSPVQKETLRRWMFDDDRILFQLEDQRRGVGPRTGSALSLEPTEILPSGIPSNMPIRLQVLEKDAVLARATSGYRYFLNLDSLVWNEMQGNQGEFLGAKYSRNFIGYRPAKERTFSASFWPKDGTKLTQSLSEYRPVPETKEIQRTEFPEAYLRRMEQARIAFQHRTQPGQKPPVTSQR